MIKHEDYIDAKQLVTRYKKQVFVDTEDALELFCKIYGYTSTEGIFVERGYDIKLKKDGNELFISTKSEIV